MEMIVLDPFEQTHLIQQREQTGSDRFDEVWEGVYVVSPLPNDEHQDIVGGLYYAFKATIGLTGLGLVRPGVNVSDRVEQWEHNYRGPDVAIFLNGTTARNHGTHWVGGPDFVVEVVSQYDQSRQKLDFYARIGVRELLLVDRYPWSLELYRLVAGVLALVGKSDLSNPAALSSEVLPLSFRLVAGEDRPRIEVKHADGVQSWSA